MNTKFLFVLLLLPGLAHAVVCKTVGEDGVASFTDVPAAECPQGSRIPEYSRPEPVVERAGSVNTGVSARQVDFAGYDQVTPITLHPAPPTTVARHSRATRRKAVGSRRLPAGPIQRSHPSTRRNRLLNAGPTAADAAAGRKTPCALNWCTRAFMVRLRAPGPVDMPLTPPTKWPFDGPIGQLMAGPNLA